MIIMSVDLGKARTGIAVSDSGEGFARVSYSYSLKHLKIALERIKEFLKELNNESKG